LRGITEQLFNSKRIAVKYSSKQKQILCWKLYMKNVDNIWLVIQCIFKNRFISKLSLYWRIVWH
jgi:hypothetical protein